VADLFDAAAEQVALRSELPLSQARLRALAMDAPVSGGMLDMLSAESEALTYDLDDRFALTPLGERALLNDYNAIATAAMPRPLTVLQYPSGRWGFAGSVPVELAFEMKDGSALDPDQVRIALSCGPGFAKKMRSRSWATREEAEAAAKATL